jgi:uncharacterized protein
VNVPEPPEQLWVHPALRVGPSGIAGQGLFATDDIAAGTLLIRLTGRLVDSAELADLIAAAVADPGAPYVDTLTVADDVHLVLPSGTMAHFGNHSCDPTIWHLGPYELGARCDVAAGEELTVDYGTSSGEPGFVMACTCGSPLCRGTVTGEDWRRPELQARYLGHWVPALAGRIDALSRDKAT